MRILLISTQDYIHHPVPSRHHYIFEELAKRHEVHTLHFHVSKGKSRKTNLIVHEATLLPIKNPAPHYLLNSLYHFKIIRKILKKYDFDVIVASHILAGYFAVLLGKKYNIPVIYDLKDWYPDSASIYYKNKIIKKILYNGTLKIILKCLSLSDVITTVSPSLVKILRSYSFNPILITNGVRTDIFRPYNVKKGKELLGYHEDEFVIGYVGSLEYWLDFETVLIGLKYLVECGYDAKLSIIGKTLFTDYELQLKNIIKKLDIAKYVRFHGFIPYEKLPHYIAGMDVCLIPFKISPVSEVALPNKFFEYTACGKPILSTPLPDLLKINPGNISFYSTVEDFKNQVIKIYEKRDAKEQKKLIKRINPKRFDWREKAREFEKIMINLVNN